MLRWLAIWICVPIYKTIPKMYSIFYFLSNARFLEEGVIDDLSKNMYVLVSVVMLFAFSATLLSAIVNPDIITDRKKGVWAIFKRAVIGIVLMILIPFTFDQAYKLQSDIMSNSVIEKVILGINYEDDTNKLGGRGGQVIAGNLISSVLYPAEDEIEVSDPDVGEAYENMITTNIDSINTVADNINIAPANNTEHEYAFEFDGLIAIIAGGVCVYILLLFAFDMAVRMFRLAFYELTAPISIVAYIGFGNKYILDWAKEVGKTYADVFIRITAMGFYLFLISHLSTFLESPTLWGLSTSDTNTSISGFGWRLLLQVIIIVGMLAFAKQLPDLINRAFGTSIGSGPKGLSGRLAPAKEAITALGKGAGAVTGAAANVGARTVGGVSRSLRNSEGQNGLLRGLRAAGAGVVGAGAGVLTTAGAARRGYKTGNLTAIGNEVARDRNTHPDGSTFIGRTMDTLTESIGMGTSLDRANERIARQNRLSHNGRFYTQDQIERIRNQYDQIQNHTQSIQDAINKELDRKDSKINSFDYTFTDSITGEKHTFSGQNFSEINRTIQALRETGPRMQDFEIKDEYGRGTGTYDTDKYYQAFNNHIKNISSLEKSVKENRIKASNMLIDNLNSEKGWTEFNASQDDSNRQTVQLDISVTNELLKNKDYAPKIDFEKVDLKSYSGIEKLNTEATSYNNEIQKEIKDKTSNKEAQYSTRDYMSSERDDQARDRMNSDNRIHKTGRDANNNH